MEKPCLTLASSLIFLLGGLMLTACSSDKDAEKTLPDPNLLAGEQLVKQNCKVCHGQGINGAPIIGNKKMWEKRIAQGVPTLVEHATQGFGLMPAKGGSSLSDEEIATAVNYMVSQVK